MLHGTDDRQVPIANVNYLRAQLSTAGKSDLFTSMVMPGYDHFIPWEHPDAVTEALNRLTNHIGSEQVR
jgi:pimeloyl-ACP methyl ester carboxylesterase